MDGIICPSLTGKLFEFPHYIIGFSGGFAAANILKKMQQLKTFKTLRINNELDCIKIQKRLFKEIKDIYDAAYTFNKDNDINLVPELLLITKDKIFSIDELSVVRQPHYAAIGSGQSVALGALHASYPDENCITKALTAACDIIDSCDYPIITKEI